MPGISMKEDMEGAGRVSTAIGENGTHGLFSPIAVDTLPAPSISSFIDIPGIFYLLHLISATYQDGYIVN
jgi:hypothetical protein